MKIAIDVRSTVLEIPDEELFSKTASEARTLIGERVRDWVMNKDAIQWQFLEDSPVNIAIAA